MNWIEFARLNQAIEHTTPTKKISAIAKDWELIDDKESFIKILSLNLNVNNLKTKKATTWIINAMEIFEEEIEMEIYTHGDIGDAVYFFNEGNGEDSSFGMKGILSLLEMDCSKSDGESYRCFQQYFLEMSALEQKWFLRYWLRTPRNGINVGTVRKLLARIYDKKETEVKKHNQLHSLPELLTYYERGIEPSNDLVVGRYIAPMLAKAIPKEKWPKEYIVEYKYDGARYQIHWGKGRCFIFNRKGVQVTEKFPDIVEIVLNWKNLPSCFIIDTEIYPIDLDGRPKPFKTMQTRIHSKNIQEAVEKCPCSVAVFDCLMYDVENLIDLPLIERCARISKFPNQAIRTIAVEDNDVFYNEAINDGYEGIMVKDLRATYHSGKRSVAWAKYKPPRFEFDVVVVGARYGEGRRASVFSSYDIAVKEKENFISVGSVGSGFSDTDLLYLTNQSKKIVSGVDNGTYNLLPRIILEVTCDLVTTDKEGNLGLRFPRMLRIREDKPVNDIASLNEVKSKL